MKKAVLFALIMAFGASMACAETVKGAAEKSGNFWNREAERSGMKDSTSSWGKFFENLNPAKFLKDQQDAYNARKGGTAAAQ